MSFMGYQYWSLLSGELVVDVKKQIIKAENHNYYFGWTLLRLCKTIRYVHTYEMNTTNNNNVTTTQMDTNRFGATDMSGTTFLGSSILVVSCAIGHTSTFIHMSLLLPWRADGAPQTDSCQSRRRRITDRCITMDGERCSISKETTEEDARR